MPIQYGRLIPALNISVLRDLCIIFQLLAQADQNDPAVRSEEYTVMLYTLFTFGHDSANQMRQALRPDWDTTKFMTVDQQLRVGMGEAEAKVVFHEVALGRLAVLGAELYQMGEVELSGFLGHCARSVPLIDLS